MNLLPRFPFLFQALPTEMTKKAIFRVGQNDFWIYVYI